jgi:hypothetical protein
MRLSMMAPLLAFLRWLIKAGAEKPRLLGLVPPVFKALPSLLRGEPHWVASLGHLFRRRSAEAHDADSADGGEPLRRFSPGAAPLAATLGTWPRRLALPFLGSFAVHEMTKHSQVYQDNPESAGFASKQARRNRRHRRVLRNPK